MVYLTVRIINKLKFYGIDRDESKEKQTVDDSYASKWNMQDSCGRKGLDETPQCVKDEGRLKPPFAGNVDIPLAGAKRLISRPPESEYIPFAVVEALYRLICRGMYLNRVALGLFSIGCLCLKCPTLSCYAQEPEEVPLTNRLLSLCSPHPPHKVWPPLKKGHISH